MLPDDLVTPVEDTLIEANNNSICLDLNLFTTFLLFLENSIFSCKFVFEVLISFTEHFKIFYISPVFLCPK